MHTRGERWVEGGGVEKQGTTFFMFNFGLSFSSASADGTSQMFSRKWLID